MLWFCFSFGPHPAEETSHETVAHPSSLADRPGKPLCGEVGFSSPPSGASLPSPGRFNLSGSSLHPGNARYWLIFSSRLLAGVLLVRKWVCRIFPDIAVGPHGRVSPTPPPVQLSLSTQRYISRFLISSSKHFWASTALRGAYAHASQTAVVIRPAWLVE